MFAIQLAPATIGQNSELILLDTDDGTFQYVYVSNLSDDVAVHVMDRYGDPIRARFENGLYDRRTHVVVKG